LSIGQRSKRLYALLLVYWENNTNKFDMKDSDEERIWAAREAIGGTASSLGVEYMWRA
jgi:hypothetical protein